MYIIENRNTEMVKEENVLVTYSDLLLIILNRPLKSRITIKEMRRDFVLLDKFEQAGDNITLTDEEYKHVTYLIESFEWYFRHKDIITFSDYILSLSKET